MNPETACGGGILKCHHEKGCSHKAYHDFRNQQERNGDCKSDACVHQCSYSECELPESLYVEHFRDVVEPEVYRPEAVLDEVPVIHVAAKAPVVVQKALRGRD